MSAGKNASLAMAALVVLAAAGEAWLLTRLLAQPEELGELLWLHAVIAAALAVAAIGLRSRASGAPVFAFFVIAVVFLGPLGVVLAGAAAAFRAAFAWRARPFAEWYGALFPDAEQDRLRSLHEHVVLRGQGPVRRVTVAPFTDVIALGTLEEKQAVIALVAGRFRPEFAPALLAALNDPEAAVRVQAASAVARIEQRFLERSMAIEERRAADPDNPALMLEAAREHEALARTGLLDEARARQAALTALDLHLRLAASRPGTAGRDEAIAASGRLLLGAGRPQDAASMLAPLARAPGAPPEILCPYLEALFRLHRFAELRELFLELRRDEPPQLPEGLRAAMLLWTEDLAASLPKPRPA